MMHVWFQRDVVLRDWSILPSLILQSIISFQCFTLMLEKKISPLNDFQMRFQYTDQQVLHIIQASALPYRHNNIQSMDGGKASVTPVYLSGLGPEVWSWCSRVSSGMKSVRAGPVPSRAALFRTARSFCISWFLLAMVSTSESSSLGTSWIQKQKHLYLPNTMNA